MEFIKKNVGLIIVFILGVIPLFSLIHSGLPLTHDGQDHVARIANFYQSLSEGNLIPRWAGNLNWGYGHPILMFLYPLSSYMASFFHVLGFSFVDSLKIIFGLGFVFSGIFMYTWLKEFLGENVAIAGAVLYMYAPYRFVDLYVRGAIGEHMAFVFPPLICYFLLKLSKKYSSLYFVGATLSLAALVLSHNALLIMFLPVIILYAAILIINSKRKTGLSIQYVVILLLGFGLSSFFIIPAFLEGKYTLRDIVTGSEALTRFANFKDIIYSAWNFGGTGSFSVQLGIVNWLLIIIFPFVLLKLKKDRKSLIVYIAFLIYFIGSIFIMLPQSLFIWKIITILQKFQFPWRFLSASIFAASVLGSFAIFVFNKKSQGIIVIAVIVLSIFLTRTYWAPKGYLDKPESFYTDVYYGTTDTGESAPIWSVRFMEKTPNAQMEVIDGSAKIKTLSRKSTDHKYEITADYRSRIRENTLYFPGWKIYIDGKEYQGVQFQDPQNRGLMTFYVLPGKHNVEVKFGDTVLRKISDYLTVFSLILLIGICLLPKSLRKFIS